MLKPATTAIWLIALPQLASAYESRCIVADPTGTPLKVRTSPYGAIIGPIDNGRRVYVMDRALDKHGKTWVYIGDTENHVGVGWVYRDYLTCGE